MHRHTFIHATHFSRFNPLSPLAILLWIWYFLISTRSRALAFLYTAISLIRRRVSFRPLISHRCCFSYPFYNLIHSFPLPLFYVNLVLILSFLFPAPLFGEHLFPLFVSPLYCASSPRPTLHYYFLASFFHFVSPHTRSSLCLLNSLNLLDTHRNSRAAMDFHSLRVLLAYDGLRT